MTETPIEVKAERGDSLGPIRFMAAVDGYVMVRRPGSMPWVETVADWVKRPLEVYAGRDRRAYRLALENTTKPTT
jgi:ABC-type thiamin/hydroxymethylpyrimidine transport system permease subunit